MTIKQRSWLLCATLIMFLVGGITAKAQVEQATLIFINFVGSDMILTLDEQIYTVPGVDTQPDGGRLTLNLAPGQYNYSGHIPGGAGDNGSVVLAAGQTVVWGSRIEKTAPVVSRDGTILYEPRDLLVFFEASLTPPAPPIKPVPDPLQPLAIGQGGLVLVNHIDEGLLVDIVGTLYTIPANERHQINLAPGEISYSANAGSAHTNGTVLVTEGAYIGLSFTRELPPQSQALRLATSCPFRGPQAINFPVSLETEAIVESPPLTPTVEPATATASSPASSLTVINYIGEAVTFTINNEVYAVPENGGEQPIQLEPGDYTFTASTPRAANNGSLQISAGIPLKASVALNVADNRIEIYIE